MNKLLPALLLAVASALPAAAAEPLKVAYNQWVGFAAAFVAAEQGFFEEAGIDVELVAFSGPGDSMAPLLAGHLDLSMTTADNAVRLAAAGSEVRILRLLDASDGGDGLVGKASIGSPAGLKGKTVAATVGEVNHLLLLKALESAGLTEADIQLVDMNPDDAGAAFVAGAVDAAVTWEPWLTRAVTEGDGAVLFSSEQAPNLLLDVIVATPETISAKSEAIAAFSAALEKASAFMEANPEAAHADAGKWLEVDGAEVAAMLEGVKLYDQADNDAAAADPATLTGPLESISSFFVEQGLIPAPVEASSLLGGPLAQD